MKIKKSQLAEVIKQVAREAIQQREYEQVLNEVSPPGKKSERMIQHVKKSLRDTHPDWSDDKIASVAIATAWKHHNKESVDEIGEPSNNSSPSNIEVIVRLLIGKGIKDPEKIKQLASQLHLKQFKKPIDLATVDQVIQKELGNVNEATYKVQKRSYKTVNDTPNDPRNVADPEVPVTENAEGWVEDFFTKVPEKDLQFIQDLMEKHGLSLAQAVKDYLEMYGKEGGKGTPIKMSPRPNELPRHMRTETAYKTQGRSYKTFEDSPKGDTNYKDDPENT